MENTKIRKTVDFLDLLCEHYKSLSEDGKMPASDYRVAKELGVTQPTTSKWRTGKGTFDDDTCLLVADTLGLHREYVLGCIHLERATSSNLRDYWAKEALRGANLALVGFSGFLVLAEGTKSWFC